MTRQIRLLTTLFVVLLARSVQPFGSGAPDSACKTLTPGHGLESQNSDSSDDGGKGSPVTLKWTGIQDNKVLPGGQVELELGGGDGVEFKGFIVQARDASDMTSLVGGFEADSDENMKLLPCSPGLSSSTATHRGRNDKSSVKLIWNAPEDFVGDVVFHYSVVVDYARYWTMLTTRLLSISASAPATASTSSLPTPISQTSTETTESQSDGIDNSESQKLSPVITTDSDEMMQGSVVKTIARDHDVYSGCGSTKLCFGMPDTCVATRDCSYVISSWFGSEPAPGVAGKWNFQLVAADLSVSLNDESDGEYVALGLSRDSRMGSDLVTACVVTKAALFGASSSSTGGALRIETSYNNGYSNMPLPSESTLKGGQLEHEAGDVRVTFVDGILDCTYSRPSKFAVSVTDATTGNVSAIDTLDLEGEKFAFLLARGRYVRGRLLQHQSRLPSAQPISLASTQTLAGQTRIYVWLHGALMVFAWLFAAPIGMLIARYFKDTWRNSDWAGVRQWFIWHRCFMVAVVITTIAGLVMILIELDFEWSAVSVSVNPHAATGISAVILACFQPILALMRCHPSDHRRPIFNGLHWLVGNCALLLSFVTIFFAVDLDRAMLSPIVDYIVLAFIICHVVCHIILTLDMLYLHCTNSRRRTRGGQVNGGQGGPKSAYPMTDMSYGIYESPNPAPDVNLAEDERHGGLRKTLLAIYSLVALLTCLAVILLIVFEPVRSYVDSLNIVPVYDLINDEVKEMTVASS